MSLKFQGSFFFFFILSFSSLFAQVPSNPLGLNPFSLKWKQINTEKFQIIFPAGLEKAGQRVANLIQVMSDSSTESVGKRQEKISIFLQNQTTRPNGFVTVGPFRSEFYITPPQFSFNGVANWLDMLSIHEYRHVQQFANGNQGISKLARRILGSWTWGGMVGTAMPRWYFEGDAVGMETALSSAGRGRLPEFDMEYKALVLAGKNYNYEKASANSLKDFVPSHYELGYYLTTQARREYGEDIWAKVVKDAVRYRGLFYPFSRSLKRHAGLRTPQLYRETYQKLQKMWQEEAQALEYSESPPINRRKGNKVVNYRNPQYLSNGEIVVEKDSYAKVPTLYKINARGEEEKLVVLGINSARNSSLSSAFSSNTVCWAEQGFDPRWGYQDFSNIKTYNLQTETKTKLSHRERFFAPALSWDGLRIMAVQISPQLKYNLVLISVTSGEVIQSIPNPDNHFYSFPRWVPEENKVVYVSQEGELNWLEEYDVDTQERRVLSEASPYQITNPAPGKEYIYFSGAHTGINNIFALQRESQRIFQVTSVPLGAFQPALSPDEDKLLYSNFTVNGYDLVEIPLEASTWQEYSAEGVSSSAIDFYQPLVEQELGESLLANAPDQEYPIKKYNKWSGIVNFHSLLPLFEPPVFGLRLLSDNKFSTLSGELGAFYNSNENELSYIANVKYAELYPVINAGFSRLNRSRSFSNLREKNDTTVTLSLYNEEWVENRLNLGLELPINFTQGAFFNNLNIRANYQYISVDAEGRLDDPDNSRFDATPLNPNRFRSLFKPVLGQESFSALDLRVFTTILHRQARQNIVPRFGIVWDMRFRSTLGGGEISGKVFNTRFDLYLPGLAANHGFYVNTAYQNEKFSDNYKFSNFFFYSRGYDTSLISDQLYKLGFNYTFPLFYPDWSWGPLVFIKRVKMNLFYDYVRSRADLVPELFNPLNNTQRSLGTELTFDIRALRLLEVNLGFRYSYLLDSNDSPHAFDFLLLSIGI